MSAVRIRWKSYRWQREIMVAGTLWTSVVARINLTYSGGSSMTFSNAPHALGESMCTSSMIYTLYFPSVGRYATSSRISRILSTPLFEAASISITFIEVPELIALQLSHTPQGLPFTGCSQFTAFANIFATDVLPVPLVPQKRIRMSDSVLLLSDSAMSC